MASEIAAEMNAIGGTYWQTTNTENDAKQQTEQHLEPRANGKTA